MASAILQTTLLRMVSFY